MTVDLTTTYLGLTLKNPLVASAGPATGHIDTLQRLAAAGAAAVVLPSLFEEEVAAAAVSAHNAYTPLDGFSAESENYLPEVIGPTLVERHVDLVTAAKSTLSIPVIASVNGLSTGGWVRYASELANAGADAIECNTYSVAADPLTDAATVEAQHLELVRAVRAAVAVPVSVKVSPYFSAFAHTVGDIVDAGADGLVCFNRFYQPDIDIGTLDVAPTLELSTSNDMRLPLRWIAILARRVRCSLALSSGVHTADDVVKAILAGADVVMTTSSLLRNGIDHMTQLRDGLARWLDAHEYTSVAEARGSVSRAAVADPVAYERANYVDLIQRQMRRLSSVYAR
jgi:dihydroorotate dehydrogenase (fumarate)